ncbi:hypothetical protein H633G_09164 [Metarhizium anisopliae BRIP 53284]|uniref:SMP domain-containing protein n=1 Tax=Metarhizium rileyi (strain RCEF 4871) TaxID=1649241 RepID=A0A5C6G6H2_METRR|nr:hypothetical protein H633G_09164 [Metarhizium anisopliae BRIP 53284]TWU71446.1 hypothetical protein ED733_000252 [Metarhizium rileyi]
MPGNQMTKSDSSRIQSSQAKGGNDMSSGGFAARAQSAGDRHDNNQHSGSGNGGSKSGAGAGAKK